MFKTGIKDRETIQYLLSQGGFSFLFRMFAMVFSFISMWFITNFYGEADYGTYALALTVLQILAMVFALGVPNAFVSFAGRIDNVEKLKGLLLKSGAIVLISSLFPILCFSFGAQFFSETVFQKPSLLNYFLVVSFSIPFMIFHEIICYYFISVKKIIAYGLFFYIFPSVSFALFLVAFYYYNLTGFFTFLAYVSSIILTVLIALVVLFYKKTKITFPEIRSKEILKKSFPMMVSGIFLILLNWTDILMLGRIESESQIGIYNTAFKLGYLTLFFVLSMNVIIMPKVAALFHQNNFSEMKKVINRSTQLVIVFTIPLAIGIIFFSENLLRLFGEGFIAGKTTLILITLGALFNAMTGNVDQILNMTNHQKGVRNIFFFGFLMNVALNLGLIPSYGIEGAALASLITNVVVNIVFVIVIKKKLGFFTFM
ncbi:flippase [Flavobacterium sp. WC2409]|jgi:O-antigen/teichoic acid export membrane protein|uniref:Flippase n=1 Tax=Flavobacterium sp. WC2409 TaxID=3234139 RepID=A0AB39W176_9FLAO